MKFKVQNTLLMGGLKLPCSIAPNKPTLPILSYVLLTADAVTDTLTIAGTDLELGAVRLIEAEVSESGSIALPAKLLYDFVSQVNDNLICEMNDQTRALTLIGETSKARATIKGLDPQEFPPMPGFNPTGIEFPTATLIRIARETTFCVAADAARPQLSGVYFYTEPGTKLLRTVSTDGFRLSTCENEVDFAMSPLIVPARTLNEFAKLSGDIHLEYDDFSITLSSGDTVIKSSVLVGNFPDIYSFVPAVLPINVIVSPTQLLRACNLANLFALEDKKLILDFTEAGVAVYSQSGDTGESDSTVGCKLSGDPIKLGFNGKYLKEVLEVFSNAELIQIAMSKPTSPVAFSAPESIPGFRHVIMPMAV